MKASIEGGQRRSEINFHQTMEPACDLSGHDHYPLFFKKNFGKTARHMHKLTMTKKNAVNLSFILKAKLPKSNDIIQGGS